jgi:hypothetical protein
MAGTTGPLFDPVQEGIRLFNERYFFEAHEVLEDAWHKERGEPRLFLQGLIQICAAYHHLQNGNVAGAITLLERGGAKVRGYPSGYLGIDTANLLAHIDAHRQQIARAEDGTEPDKPLDFPRIERNVEG